jgi:hypothetical protein
MKQTKVAAICNKSVTEGLGPYLLLFWPKGWGETAGQIFLSDKCAFFWQLAFPISG